MYGFWTRKEWKMKNSKRKTNEFRNKITQYFQYSHIRYAVEMALTKFRLNFFLVSLCQSFCTLFFVSINRLSAVSNQNKFKKPNQIPSLCFYKWSHCLFFSLFNFISFCFYDYFLSSSSSYNLHHCLHYLY